MSSIDEHYAGLYAAWDDGGLAVEVEITPAVDTNSYPVMAIDKREGVEMDIGDGTLHAGKPAMIVRVSELAGHGLTPQELVKGTIEAGTFRHEIAAWAPRPGPGLHSGEAYLILGRKL